MGIYEELEWRGLIKDVSDPSLKEKLNKGGMKFYIGTDPTGDSLHIGHFSSFLICKRLKEAGHYPIVLVGGATGLIGDPKPDSERPMVSKETIEHNFTCLKEQLVNLFGCEVVNNYDWSKDINFIDFLRDYGKFFNINYMLNKDIVARRLDQGITYTEFSYMIMQALDFLWLYENKDTYNIDLNNVLVAGESAGGYFIAMLADLKNNPEKMERIGVSSKYINKVNIKALVSICGAFDLKRMVDKTKQQSKFPDMKIFTQAFVGKSGKEFKEWIASENAVDASPQITQSFPPTFLVWASNDKLRYDSFDIMKEFGENNVEYAQFEANKEIANHAWAIITQLPTAKLGLYYTLKFILPKFSKYFEEIDDYWHFKN